MKRLTLLLIAVVLSSTAYADTVHLTLTPKSTVEKDKKITVTAQFTNSQTGKPLTDAALKRVHTKKFHLLVIDPSLTDYQHIHPRPTAKAGIYQFTFTPHMANGYRAWADITPIATGKQQYVMATMGTPKEASIDKTQSYEATVDGNHYVLSFDEPPTVDKASMGEITITDAQGAPLTSLEPVMSAFAHIVGFYDDAKTVVHTHPMGDEPTKNSERGGPTLSFHLAPSKAGFIKIFAQVKINGEEQFVPFGVHVHE